MVGGHDHRAALGEVLQADPPHPEVDVEEGLEQRPDDQVDQEVDALLPRAAVIGLVVHVSIRTRSGGGRYSWPVGVRTRTLRGALCGARGRGRLGAGAAAGQAPAGQRLRRRRAARQGGHARQTAGTRSGWPCTCGTGPCSAPCTRTSRDTCPCRRPARARGGPQRARGAVAPGLGLGSPAPRPPRAPRAPRQRPGLRPGRRSGTCCSAWSWASSSGALNADARARPAADRDQLLNQRPRLARARGLRGAFVGGRFGGGGAQGLAAVAGVGSDGEASGVADLTAPHPNPPSLPSPGPAVRN